MSNPDLTFQNKNQTMGALRRPEYYTNTVPRFLSKQICDFILMPFNSTFQIVGFAVMFAFHASQRGLEQFCVAWDKREQRAETTGGRRSRGEDGGEGRAGAPRGLAGVFFFVQMGQTSQKRWLF